jgi:hypothetical protein
MASECYRVTVEGDALSYYWANVLHFIGDNNNDASPLSMAQELVGALNTIFSNDWVDFNAIGTVCHSITAKRILPGGGNSYWKEFPEGAMKGNISQQIGALSLAPIVKLYGGLAEGIQGRIFLPPPPETEVTNNIISTFYHNQVIEWVEAMTSFTEDHDWNLAVYSKKNNAAYPVSTTTISDILGQIRRRRRPG